MVLKHSFDSFQCFSVGNDIIPHCLFARWVKLSSKLWENCGSEVFYKYYDSKCVEKSLQPCLQKAIRKCQKTLGDWSSEAVDAAFSTCFHM